MGSNVFVSYKYKDNNVAMLGNKWNTTCRDYVDEIQNMLEGRKTYYFRGEEDGEDMSVFDDDTIASKLADKIFYTSVTVVLISAGMKDLFKKEKDQWIPWEISYSLKETSRASGRSRANAVLAVTVPDRSGSYDFAMFDCMGKTLVREDSLFKIIGENMSNRKKPAAPYDNYIYVWPVNRILMDKSSIDDSYIPMIRWRDFKSNPEYYLNLALEHRDHSDDYNLVKKIDPSW